MRWLPEIRWSFQPLASGKRQGSGPVIGLTRLRPESECSTLAGHPAPSRLPTLRRYLTHVVHELLDRVSLRIAARQCRHFGPESTLRLLVNHDGILRHILILAQRACSARRQAWRPAPLTARRGATRRWAVPPNERPTGSP